MTTRSRRPFSRSFLAPLLVVAALGCGDAIGPEVDWQGDDSLPALPPPIQPTVAGGLQLFGSSTLGGGGRGEPYPSVRVEAINTTSAPIRSDDICLLEMRLFRSGAADARPAWRGPLQSLARCAWPATHVIRPGDRFDVNWLTIEMEFQSMRAMLGDSLRPGLYDLQGLVRVGAELVAVPAGSLVLLPDDRPPSRDPWQLRYRAGVRAEGGSVSARIVITNPTIRAVHLQYGCALVLAAYRTPERSGTPVWRSDRGPGAITACSAILNGQILAPAESGTPLVFHGGAPVGTVLGGRPEGRYYFLAELTFHRDTRDSYTSDVVRLPIGSAYLRHGSASP